MGTVRGDCGDLCAKCEELMQQYLDRELTDAERIEAEAHLKLCGYCEARYRFESSLRRYVRGCCEEPMRVELREKLSELRTRLL